MKRNEPQRTQRISKNKLRALCELRGETIFENQYERRRWS
jgi:hypothetical protein